MSEWDFLWGLQGEELKFAMSHGYTNTDSLHVAHSIARLDGTPSTWLLFYEMAGDKLLVKFTKTYHKLISLLVEKSMLNFKTLHSA